MSECHVRSGIFFYFRQKPEKMSNFRKQFPFGTIYENRISTNINNNFQINYHIKKNKVWQKT